MAATTAIKEQIRETLVRRHASRGVTARIFVADAETAEFSCEHVVASDVACSMAQQRFQKGAEHTGSSDKFGRSEGDQAMTVSTRALFGRLQELPARMEIC